MAYLRATRHGLTKVEPTTAERQGGWRLVWEHPDGLRAVKHPVTGRWYVSDGSQLVGGGFANTLRAASKHIERISREVR